MSKMEAFKAGFGFGGKEQKKVLPKQFPVSAPLSMHKKFFNNYVKGGFAEKFLEEKGIAIADEYKAGSFSEYIKLRGIGNAKAYGGRIQPRKATAGSEMK